jgi:hypothetical protein
LSARLPTWRSDAARCCWPRRCRQAPVPLHPATRACLWRVNVRSATRSGDGKPAGCSFTFDVLGALPSGIRGEFEGRLTQFGGRIQAPRVLDRILCVPASLREKIRACRGSHLHISQTWLQLGCVSFIARPSHLHGGRMHFGLTASLRPTVGQRDCGLLISDCGLGARRDAVECRLRSELLSFLRSYSLTLHVSFSVAP